MESEILSASALKNTEPANPPDKRFWIREFTLLSLLFIVIRLLPLLTGLERVSHYDELSLGAIAKDWLSGVRLPFWHYQLDPYGGESILLGLLSIPFIKWLGPSLLAVKMPSLIFAYSLFAISVFFLKRFFGIKPALRGGLLLIFCAPSFVQFSLAGLSGHAESIVFSLLSLFFLYHHLFHSGKNLSLFAAAFFAGIGFWIYQETIIASFAGLILWGLAAQRKRASSTALAVLGVLLGLVPFMLYCLYYSDFVSSFLSTNASGALSNFSSLKGLAEKMRGLLLNDLPLSFAFFPVAAISKELLSRTYWAVLSLLLLVQLRYVFSHDFKTKLKLLFFFIYPVLFCAFYTVSYFGVTSNVGYIGYRYLAPLQFFLFLFAALLPCRLKFERFLFFLLLGIGLLGQSALYFKEPFARVINHKGFSYYRLGTQWFHTLYPVIKEPEDFSREIKRRDPADAFYLLWGISSVESAHNGMPLLNTQKPVTLADMEADFPPAAISYLTEWKGALAESTGILDTLEDKKAAEFQKYFLKGFTENKLCGPEEDLSICLAAVSGSMQVSEWLLRAIGRSFYLKLSRDPERPSPEKILKEIRNLALPESFKKEIIAGIPLGALQTSWDGNTLWNPTLEEFSNQLLPAEQKPFYWGIGWVSRAMDREDRLRALDRIQNLPKEPKKDAMRGFIQYENWYQLPQESPA